MVGIRDIGSLLSSDDLVNLLIVAGIIVGVGKWLHGRYQSKLEEEISAVEKQHKDDIAAVHKSVEDKFAELLRYYNGLQRMFMSVFGPRFAGMNEFRNIKGMGDLPDL